MDFRTFVKGFDYWQDGVIGQHMKEGRWVLNGKVRKKEVIEVLTWEVSDNVSVQNPPISEYRQDGISLNTENIFWTHRYAHVDGDRCLEKNKWGNCKVNSSCFWIHNGKDAIDPAGWQVSGKVLKRLNQEELAWEPNRT